MGSTGAGPHLHGAPLGPLRRGRGKGALTPGGTSADSHGAPRSPGWPSWGRKEGGLGLSRRVGPAPRLPPPCQAQTHLPMSLGRLCKETSFKARWPRWRSWVKPSGSLQERQGEPGAGQMEPLRATGLWGSQGPRGDTSASPMATSAPPPGLCPSQQSLPTAAPKPPCSQPPHPEALPGGSHFSPSYLDKGLPLKSAISRDLQNLMLSGISGMSGADRPKGRQESARELRGKQALLPPPRTLTPPA